MEDTGVGRAWARGALYQETSGIAGSFVKPPAILLVFDGDQVSYSHYFFEVIPD